MLTPRQEKILLCLIQEFIDSAEPVASQILWEKYNLDFSPATIRNEMARLEEIGYLEQPHTSAGRIPTVKSYRLYVDRLMSQQDISQPDETFNLKARLREGELVDLLEQASHILAQLTRYTSVILTPRARRGLFKILQLSLISRHTLLLTMLTNSGFLINKVIEVGQDFDVRLLPKITRLLNERLRGTPLDHISYELVEHILGEQEFYNFNYQFLRLLSLSIEKLTQHLQDRLIYDGTSYLFEMPEFKDAQKLKEILQLLEEEKLMAEVLSKSLEARGVKVWLGEDFRLGQLNNVALVTANYKFKGEPIGSLGILGPTRMPYQRTISVVRYMAQGLSEIISQILA